MAVGQNPLSVVLDVPALDRVEVRLQVAVVERCAAHGRRLRDALELDRVLTAAGVSFGTSAHLALVEQTSELTAGLLLEQAQVLAALPGGLEALDCGLLSPEQAAVVARVLGSLERPVRLAVWELLVARLLIGVEQGLVLAPARLGELMRGWVLTVDPDGAAGRRRAAEAAGSVDYRRREDGLADIFATGLSGPNAQAVLQRIRSRAASYGSQDPRSAGKRRLDAFVDLLLGRDQLPLGLEGDDLPFQGQSFPDDLTVPARPGDRGAGDSGPGCCGGGCRAVGWRGGRCGCRLGEAVPCGLDVALLVPLGAALATTDELADLVGHGPLEPDLLQHVLHTSPRIRTVWVDHDGTPVATGDHVHTPPRGDPQALRDLLLRLAASRPPGPLTPRHPHDHPPPDGPAPDEVVLARAVLEAAAGHGERRRNDSGWIPRDPAAAGRIPTDPAAAGQAHPVPGGVLRQSGPAQRRQAPPRCVRRPAAGPRPAPPGSGGRRPALPGPVVPGRPDRARPAG